MLGYAFRQARTPIITYGSILFAALIGGAAIVETVFAWGGLGQFAIERANSTWYESNAVPTTERAVFAKYAE